MRFMVRKLPSPTIFSTGLRPEFIGIFGIPTRHMDPIGHMAYGNFGYRPTWKKLAKEISAHLAMQAANTVHGTTATNGEIGHIKTLPSIIGICPTQGHQVVEIDTQFFLGIPAKKLLHKRWAKVVKTGGDRRMRRK